MSHISCNMHPRDLPDISALTLGRRAYISGKSLMPMLQLPHIANIYTCIYTVLSSRGANFHKC